MTLDELYTSTNGEYSAEYSDARRRKVGEIETYILPYLRNPGMAEDLALQIMAEAEEYGMIDGDRVLGAVLGCHTKTGAPHLVLC